MYIGFVSEDSEWYSEHEYAPTELELRKYKLYDAILTRFNVDEWNQDILTQRQVVGMFSDYLKYREHQKFVINHLDESELLVLEQRLKELSPLPDEETEGPFTVSYLIFDPSRKLIEINQEYF